MFNLEITLILKIMLQYEIIFLTKSHDFILRIAGLKIKPDVLQAHVFVCGNERGCVFKCLCGVGVYVYVCVLVYVCVS